MKFLIALILTALLSFAGALFFPWWVIAVAAFVVAVSIPQKPLRAFLTGFLALFLLWGIQSYIIDAQNQHILSSKVAELLKLNSYVLMILITALVGGIVSGMASLTGSFLRNARHKPSINK